jgi:hypothetical protein
MTTLMDHPSCALGARGCHRAAPGAFWRVEWRVGFGAPASLALAGVHTECAVLARTPSPASPGSYKRLVEVVGSGKRVWLDAAAPDLAASALARLERVRRALALPWGLGDFLHRWRAVTELGVTLPYVLGQDAVVDALHAVTRVLEAAADDRGAVSVLARERCRARLEVLYGAALAEATSLAEAWRGHDASLAHAFVEVSQALSSDRPPRRRRYVQMYECFVPIVAPLPHGSRRLSLGESR